MHKSCFQRNIGIRVGGAPTRLLIRLSDADKPLSSGAGRILDCNWIKNGLLKEWRFKCHSVHGNRCESINAKNFGLKSRPNLLVDTLRMCITYTQPTDVYIALSYVWGGCDQLKTLKSNLAELMRDKSLPTMISMKLVWMNGTVKSVRDWEKPMNSTMSCGFHGKME